MLKKFIDDFRSPQTRERYNLCIEEESEGKIKKGYLFNNQEKIPIVDYIPRFASSKDYTESFDLQWNIFMKTQLDSSNLTKLTNDRFFTWTRWTQQEIKGEKVLEAGSGAGRFTEILLQAEAIVYSFDLSRAVEANYLNNQSNNLCLFQADIYNIPLPGNFFDKVFCYGVLQHTPNPKKAFFSLCKHLRPGGKMSIDCYLKDGSIQPWKSKYLWRPLTTKMNKELLLKIFKIYIPIWFPFDTVIKKIPFFGRLSGSIIPCWNYTGTIRGYKNLLEWAIMDTFDALATKYDLPQTMESVRSWFLEADLKDYEVVKGSNGIVGNGTKR